MLAICGINENAHCPCGDERMESVCHFFLPCHKCNLKKDSLLFNIVLTLLYFCCCYRVWVRKIVAVY